MFDQETGHRYQEQLRTNPAVAPVRSFAYPLKGRITKVSFKDDSENHTGQTLVDIDLLGGMSYLVGVPLSASKANAISGEEWTPEPGDLVVVQFFNGQWNDPVVTGFINMKDNSIQATSKQVPSGKRRYRLYCNKTDIVIDKDGNRTVTVAANDTLTIKGDGKVIVSEGKLDIEVQTGGVNITVKGDAVISAENVNLIAKQLLKLIAPSVECSGNMKVAGTVIASAIADSTGPMAALRTLYLAHTHQENGVGGGITSPPITAG